MNTFATPHPITATLTTGGARVRIAASERPDTVVRVEPLDRTNASGGIEVGVDAGSAASVDADSTKGAVRDFLPARDDLGEFGDKVTIHARTRRDDIVIHRADMS